MESVQSTLHALLGGTDGINEETHRSALLDRLRADLTQFGKDVLEHLDHEELYYATPVARKVGRVEQVCQAISERRGVKDEPRRPLR